MSSVQESQYLARSLPALYAAENADREDVPPVLVAEGEDR